MSKHCIELEWQRLSDDFNYENYSRTHLVKFKEGQEMQFSAAAEFLGEQKYADPEQTLLAAVSSCHMLTFLAIASKSRLVIDEYRDSAEAILELNPETKKYWVSEMTLNPKIKFQGELPSPDRLRQMHEKSHANCFIANSIKSKVKINIHD